MSQQGDAAALDEAVVDGQHAPVLEEAVVEDRRDAAALKEAVVEGNKAHQLSRRQQMHQLSRRRSLKARRRLLDAPALEEAVVEGKRVGLDLELAHRHRLDAVPRLDLQPLEAVADGLARRLVDDVCVVDDVVARRRRLAQQLHT